MPVQCPYVFTQKSWKICPASPMEASPKTVRFGLSTENISTIFQAIHVGLEVFPTCYFRHRLILGRGVGFGPLDFGRPRSSDVSPPSHVQRLLGNFHCDFRTIREHGIVRVQARNYSPIGRLASLRVDWDKVKTLAD